LEGMSSGFMNNRKSLKGEFMIWETKCNIKPKQGLTQGFSLLQMSPN
jgi:hypothetical protein